MAKSLLENPIFKDATKARAWLEALLWTDGRSCGYCGTVDESTELPARPGYYQCNACRKQFTVMVGTVFERSHIPLNKWLFAAFLLCASKKGISAHQMHRMVGITYKSAWFMMHRLREAMAPAGKRGPMGGEGKVIEADETYLGKRDGRPSKPDTLVSGFGWVKHPKIETQRKIVALVERGGEARSFVVQKVDKATIRKVLFTNADRKSILMTDEHHTSYRIQLDTGKHVQLDPTNEFWRIEVTIEPTWRNRWGFDVPSKATIEGVGGEPQRLLPQGLATAKRSRAPRKRTKAKRAR